MVISLDADDKMYTLALKPAVLYKKNTEDSVSLNRMPCYCLR